MPHVVIEYSRPLAGQLDMQDFVDLIHETLAQQEEFDISGVRTRATPCEHFRIKEYGQDRQFVHILIHILAGRSEKNIQAAVQALGEMAMRVLPQDIEFSIEMREMRNDFYFKPSV